MNSQSQVDKDGILVSGPWFKDNHGRNLLLRGVNLGGSSKIPCHPDGATYNSKSLLNHRQVSFVGRPFPLDEADEHFNRLRKWGLTFLRFVVTWEAVEHAGPGIYDQDYLDYIHAIVEKAAKNCINLIIDFHQDVWSRFSGGDGAPGWTLEAIGMNITNIHCTGAAFLHQNNTGPLPRLIWVTNSTKLAAATMFTLFFGGNYFAPETKIDGEPVQEYLQRHYIESIKQIAIRLKGLPNVVGYGTMNEPLCGYIGWRDLNKPRAVVEVGAIPSPFQSMLLGAGIPQEIDVWERRITGPKLVGKRILNPDGLRIWQEGHDCIWRDNGVWDLDGRGYPQLLRPDYFENSIDGRQVNFSNDYYLPFINRFIESIKSVHPKAIFFIDEEVLHREVPVFVTTLDRVVYAPHWYDAVVLFLKLFNSYLGYDEVADKIIFGPRSIRRSFKEQLARFRKHAVKYMANAPVLIGESGIAFDLNNKKAYRTGSFKAQVRAMDRTLRAFDDNLLSYTLWNYTSDNTNEHGDMWNNEDFSIFSRDQQNNPNEIHSGGRALEAIVRPFTKATAGEPLQMSFNITSKVYEFTFRHDPMVSAPTLIFIPEYHYPRGYDVIISDGNYEIDPKEQILIYYHSQTREIHRVQVRPSK